ncbi:MAG TPA: amino acid permease [Allosphingosinicella sp.]|uniref:amino acid permease n=1 Tax=Allosphingosinicella sp. TaxID=2823234 RepID=UPI002ED83067
MSREPANAPDRLGPRALGFWTCLALVIGNMIGSGIFLLPASLAPYGWNAVLGWTLTIAGSLCLAFVLARLARSFPKEGGPYAYSRLAFGEGAAFALSWSYWISIWVTNGTLAIAAVSYLSIFVPGLAEVTALPAIAAITLLWIFTLLSMVSIRAAGGFQLVTTVLKLVPLVAAILIAAAILGREGSGAAAPFRPEEISLPAITACASLTLWAMLGFESATVPAARVTAPERTIPRATLYGTLIAGAFYLLASSSVSLLLPAAEAAQSNAPFADFTGRYLGEGAGMLVALFAAISCIGALNGWIFLQGEMPLAMARDGVFPAWFGRLSKMGTPVGTQMLSSTLATILVISNYTKSIGQLFTFMALLATVATRVMYVMCALAALRLMGKGAMPRTGALTLSAVLGGIYGLWTFYGAGVEATGWGLLLLASGLPVYLLMRRARSSRAAADGRDAPQE